MAEKFDYTKSWLNEEDFPLLGFSRNWENPSDYPTIETDEAQVRRDMQSLHDEVKDYLNDTLIPRVIAEDATVAAWQAQEDAHAEAEAGRVLAEEVRATNEQNRETAEAEREQIIAKVENLTVSSEALEYGEPASAEVTTNPETGGLNVHFGLPMGKDGLSFLPVIEGDDVPDGVEAWIDPSIEPTDGLYSYSKEQTDKLLQRKVNPNLLDNAYFGHPVDQRGGYVVVPGTDYYVGGGGAYVGTTEKYVPVTKWDGAWPYITVDGSDYVVAQEAAVRGYTGAGYTVDRWKIAYNPDNLTLLITENGIKVSGTSTTGLFLGHWFEEAFGNELSGKTCTVSLLFDDGTILSGSGVYPASGGVDVTLINTGDVRVYFQYNASSQNKPCVVIVMKNANKTVKAAKLELGTEQTLAHQDENGNWVLNEIPKYKEVEYLCTAYQLDFSPNSSFTSTFAATFIGSGYFVISVPLVAPLVKTPSVDGISLASFQIANDPSYWTPDSVRVASVGKSYVTLMLHVSGVSSVNSGGIDVRFVPGHGKWLLDANL